jgi:hypothetical protein
MTRRALGWVVLAALLANLLWPTTMVVASTADPTMAVLFSPICKAGDDSPTQVPRHAAHCPLCLIAGSLVGPVTPILAFDAPLSARPIPVTPDAQASPAGIQATPQQARAPPFPA